MISVICIYNNEDILNNWLLKSLKDQTVEFELIAIDNTRNIFKSAAEALNHGGNKAQGKYIMFVHQDVDLYSNTWLENAEKILDSISNLGIAGVAGRSEDKEEVITNIKHGNPPKLVEGIRLKNPMMVQTVDECLIIIPNLVFNKLLFDEKTCNDWHLYGVDYALSVRRLYLYAYAIPMFIYHRSTGILDKNYFQIIRDLGTLPKGYYQTLNKLLKKHRKSYKQIYTTCGTWNTSQPLIRQRIVKLKMYLRVRLRFEYLF